MKDATTSHISLDILTGRYLLLVIELYSCLLNNETVHGGICEIARRRLISETGPSYDLEQLKRQCIEIGRNVPEMPF